MHPRTKRQKEVLDYIVDFIADHGYAPSYQQIARHFGLRSKGGIARHVEALERQGLVLRKRDAGGFHLELVSDDSISDRVFKIEWLKIPGDSLDQSAEIPSVFVPTLLLKTHQPKTIRAFRVPDDSMLDEHICAGDIALIDKRSFARDHDCVVAIIEDQNPVIRTFYRIGADVELRSANDKFEPIKISGDQIKILGIFQGLLRPANY